MGRAAVATALPLPPPPLIQRHWLVARELNRAGRGVWLSVLVA